MSYKIYSGFKFRKSNPSLKYINEIISEIREKALAKCQEYTYSELIGNYVYVKDFEEKEEPDIVNHLFDSYGKQFIEKHRLYFAGILSLHLFPFRNKVYFYSYSSPDMKYEDLISEHPEIRDYSYWNNTDKPDNVTDREWQARYETWSSVIGSVIPEDYWYQRHVVSQYDLSGFSLKILEKKTDFRKYIPTLEKRIKNYSILHESRKNREETGKIGFVVLSQIMRNKELHEKNFDWIKEKIEKNSFEELNLIQNVEK